MPLHFNCSKCGNQWAPVLRNKSGIYDIGAEIQCPKCGNKKDLIDCQIKVK